MVLLRMYPQKSIVDLCLAFIPSFFWTRRRPSHRVDNLPNNGRDSTNEITVSHW